MNVDVQVDMTGFNRGFALASQYTSKTPAEAANFAGKEVAFGAYQNTTFVQPQTIVSELEVLETPVIGKRGKPLKNKKKFVAAEKPDEVALAVLIVQARANPNSRYNQLTNKRYALSGSPFKGVSREAGRAAMALAVDLMTKSRRKATHFIAAGWLESIRILKSVLPSKYNSTRAFVAGQGEKLGTAAPAQSGQYVATCTIENDVGLEGENAASHNRALLQTAPALQRAIDTEGVKQMNYYLRKTGQEELEIPVNKAWS